MTLIDLLPLLEVAGLQDRSSLDQEDLRLFALSLGFSEGTADEFVAALQTTFEKSGGKGMTEGHQLRVGSLRLDLTVSAVRAALMTAILAASLAASGGDNLGVALLTAIVPSILDIERVSLSESDEALLLDLRALPLATRNHSTVQELYDELPADVQRNVNRYDFHDFLGRLRRVGLTDDSQSAGQACVRIRRDGDSPPTIDWS